MREKEVFAIVKNGRRIEDINYLTEEGAKARLNQYRNAYLMAHKKLGLKTENSKYAIMKTSKPNKIW
jgi:hypothetical protein